MNTNGVESTLQLQELLFDKLAFTRKGPKNDHSINSNFSVQIGSDRDTALFKVILTLKVDKQDEYEVEICIHGVFHLSCDDEAFDEEVKRTLIQKNTVAIMMPYVRSQLSLMTSQPGVEPIVLPPFNINAMLDSRQ